MFGHVIDEDPQLRGAVLARRPHGTDDANVLDIFAQDPHQRAFRHLAAHGEVGNARHSDAQLGERHQRLDRRRSGRNGKRDVGVGTGLRERPALELDRKSVV